jgi:hypothetical protein
MERMEKQTAVEWLENEFQEIFKEWGGLDTNWIKRFEQAKAMEKNNYICSKCKCSLDGKDMQQMQDKENT